MKVYQTLIPASDIADWMNDYPKANVLHIVNTEPGWVVVVYKANLDLSKSEDGDW